jgi:ABC-type xylose transport system permease subunit
MIFVSMAINIVIFLLIFNWSYLSNRRNNPDYPAKPVSQAIVFPLALAVIFTLLVDAYRGIMYYQLIMFLVAGLILFGVFYLNKKK